MQSNLRDQLAMQIYINFQGQEWAYSKAPHELSRRAFKLAREFEERLQSEHASDEHLQKIVDIAQRATET